MNKINFKILSLLFLGLTFASCEDDLNVKPNDVQNVNDFLNDPNNAVQLVNGVYNKQLDYNMYSFSWIGMTSITSDDADKGSTPSDTGTDKGKMDNLTFSASDISFSDVWQGRYQGINRANTALFYLDQLTIDATLKNRLIGEVKFLRALFYFDLVRCFGGVPIVTTKIDINDAQTINSVVYTRKSKEETYAQIETDLLDAIDKLPLKSVYSSNDLGRASKGAAQALLAKAYLYQEKWQQAFDMSGEVITSSQYSLLPNYANVWREVGENKSESIYEVQATLTQGLVDYTNVQGPRGTPDLGWGFNTPSLTLVNSYEAGDLRKNATVMFVPSVLWDGFIAPTTWNNPRYNYKAYQSSVAESWNGDKGQTAKNLRILKYSDILLIRAESGFHIGMTSEAAGRISELRVRAGLGSVTSVTLQSILNERRAEMAMEHDRWFDIVRTGQAQSAMALDGKTFIVGVHNLFPIPSDQIIASGGLLTQNPGY
ncbi:RagB/SusD family nutrient uptake outer membrane protein [Flavobacterium paronense]|uniref:RagB/SusD family nutrient uptake outer membrane protein n=1 Tax=Flavobacterium paronense TaxID=1392775 RepID=A0ABV5GH12_9FLAO|nr:RagB/SusD family nutrient uptake outer membrane protein [Flavobacterium paronense]MDN3677297.1 RagB/SusD family nutrient uptake outer membrane protein [Flavobacterium paronense]